MDRLLADYFGAPDLEFMWATTPSLDPLVQAEVNQIYLAAGVKTVAEVREELGIGKDLIDTAKVGKFNFNVNQPRDEHGQKWVAEGDGSTPPEGSRNADGSVNVTIRPDPKSELYQGNENGDESGSDNAGSDANSLNDNDDKGLNDGLMSEVDLAAYGGNYEDNQNGKSSRIIIDKNVPSDAKIYTAGDGTKFNIPPSADFKKSIITV